MEDSDTLFGWLVDYHCSVNIHECLPHLRSGRVLDHEERAYEPGTENKHYTGCMIIANGDTLADKLTDPKGRVVLNPRTSSDIRARFKPAGEREQLYAHLQEIPEDGAEIYDGVNKRIAHVETLSNNPPGVPEELDLSELLPEGETIRGNRTYVAVVLPVAYSNKELFQRTESYQIRQSAYGSLGMGKVSHFTSEGLRQEFFLEYYETEGIIGIHRVYKRTADSNNPVLESESRRVILTLEDISLKTAA